MSTQCFYGLCGACNSFEAVWYPDNEAAKSVLKGAGVEFKNGRPDFSSWMNGKPLVFNPGDLDGSRRDFDAVYEVIRIKLKLPSKEAAKRLLRERGLTPHHHDDRTIQLIPTDLHGNVPHIGSASDMRIIAGK